MINYLPPKLPNFRDDMGRLFPEEELVGKTAKEFTLQVTEDCCMACTYCYQGNKSSQKMNFSTAKIFIDKLLNDEYNTINTKNTFAIAIEFIGGEPLLEINLITEIWEYLIQSMIKLNHPWLFRTQFSMCSNGILFMNKNVQNFFNKYHNMGSFSISIDGNKDLHDLCRVDLQGHGTYDRAIYSAKEYKKLHGKMPDTKFTLSPDNVSFLYSAILNLIQEGYTVIPVNCVYEAGWTYNEASILYSELKKIANYLIDNNLYSDINIRFFDEDLYQPLMPDDDTNWCGGVGDETLAIDYRGDIYPCIRYMQSSLNNLQPPLNLGNVYTGYMSCEKECKNHELISNITRRSQSTDECFYCPVASGCGWCSAYNYQEFGTPNKRATYICVMHKAAALANVYYWNKLYKKLNLSKIFINYLSDNECLNIISPLELDELKQLIKEE